MGILPFVIPIELAQNAISDINALLYEINQSCLVGIKCSFILIDTPDVYAGTLNVQFPDRLWMNSLIQRVTGNSILRCPNNHCCSIPEEDEPGYWNIPFLDGWQFWTEIECSAVFPQTHTLS